MTYCRTEEIKGAEQFFKSGTLSHAEIADTLLFLRKNGCNPAQLKKISGLQDYTIRHYLRVSKKLEPSIKDLLHRNKISFSMARAIASLPAKKQDDEARKALMTGTSVRDFRAKISGHDEHQIDQKTKIHFERLAMLMSDQTGMCVSITPDRNNRTAGILHMRFSDLQDFDAICARINVKLDEL